VNESLIFLRKEKIIFCIEASDLSLHLNRLHVFLKDFSDLFIDHDLVHILRGNQFICLLVLLDLKFKTQYRKEEYKDIPFCDAFCLISPQNQPHVKEKSPLLIIVLFS